MQEHNLTNGAVLTPDRVETLRERLARNTKPFAQILDEQRVWVDTHKPFDTVARLPLMQFFIEGEEGGTKTALVPFKDLSLQVSVHPDAYNMTEHAEKQLLARLGYDRRLFDILPAKLNFWNVNHLIQEHFKKQVMLRVIDGNQVRAFQSDIYQPFDILELLEQVEPFMNGGDTKWSFNDQLTFHLTVTFPTTSTEIRVGDMVRTGIHISNSEVGLRSVTIASVVERLSCTNLALGKAEDGGFFRFRHTGDGETLRERIAGAVEAAKMDGSKLIAEFKAATEKDIPDPYTYIQNVAEKKTNNLTQDDFKKLMDSYLKEPDPTLFGVVNTFTRSAHENYDGEKRFEMQRLGTRVLEEGLRNG